MASENPSTSAIEEVINEIEVYIDNCKYQPLSNTKIIVNKEEIDEKIITNKEAILNDARTKARSLLDETAEQSHELLSDHEITKLANEQAQKMIDEAALKARGIIDEATRQANAMKASAVQYTDRLLKEFEQVLSRTVSTTQRSYESFTGQLARYQETVHSNREELKPALSNAPAYETAEAASYDEEQEGYAETADGIQEAEE